MSAYEEKVTNMKDADLLIESLKALGIKEIQVHQTAVHLTGYHGDTRPETAEIVIPRRAIGFASNDIGFKRQEDGTFKAIISDFDSHTFDKPWLTKLKVAYNEAGTMRNALKAGLRFIGKKSVNGKLQLQFVKA